MGSVICDTGPLVALLSRGDGLHDWANKEFNRLKGPVFTCDAVLTEAFFLLQDDMHALDALWGLLSGGLVISAFASNDHKTQLAKLMRKYAIVPMSFADACLVTMHERSPNSVVCTFDSDFLVYRTSAGKALPVLSQWSK